MEICCVCDRPVFAYEDQVELPDGLAHADCVEDEDEDEMVHERSAL